MHFFDVVGFQTWWGFGMQIVNLRTSVLVCMKHTVQGGKNRQGNRLVLDGWNLVVCDVCGRVRVSDVIFKYWQILQHGILEIWFRCRRDIQDYFLSFIHKSNSQDSPLSAPNSFSTATDQVRCRWPQRGSEWPEGGPGHLLSHAGRCYSHLGHIQLAISAGATATVTAAAAPPGTATTTE